ncbi:hypothetical protein PM082_023419 [Marasmius tenuissimus]|nr:hypothetical protein PM082_023419 [Marasmius tenuissimus]
MIFGELTRLGLVVSTAYVLVIAFSPPLAIKMPPQPTSKSPWPVWREYVIMRVFATATVPAQRVVYLVVTILESVYILSSILQGSPTSPRPGSYVPSAGVSLIPAPASLRPHQMGVVGLLVAISGCLLRIACYRALGANFTFENTTPKGLVTSGPYTIVRHPSYLGWWLTLVGLPWYHLSNGTWIVESGFVDWQVGGMGVGKTMVYSWVLVSFLTGVALSSRAGYEDSLLKEQFGPEWEAWSRRVKYKVFPGVF